MTTIAIRLRRTLGELNYAQRRLFEIRTGAEVTPRLGHPVGPAPLGRRGQRELERLEAAWAAADAVPAAGPELVRCGGELAAASDPAQARRPL